MKSELKLETFDRNGGPLSRAQMDNNFILIEENINRIWNQLYSELDISAYRVKASVSEKLVASDYAKEKGSEWSVVKHQEDGCEYVALTHKGELIHKIETTGDMAQLYGCALGFVFDESSVVEAMTKNKVVLYCRLEQKGGQYILEPAQLCYFCNGSLGRSAIENNNKRLDYSKHNIAE